jgi:tetratricopeptide (TPR) repeat protein
LDALQKEKEAKDAEMEAEAKKAQEEEAGGEEAEEDDHDNRRLPKKRRMEIVMKNKAEANELFSDGNYKFAAARYTKALSHCAKFVDLNPEGVEEVNGVKLSLDLNLALAYLKLENPDQALRVCHDALAIDGENAKALYRRAFVYNEKKQWDLANKDIKKAAKVAPDDKAIKKLQDRIDAQLERQKLKQKKMAQKMFG